MSVLVALRAETEIVFGCDTMMTSGEGGGAGPMGYRPKWIFDRHRRVAIGCSGYTVGLDAIQAGFPNLMTEDKHPHEVWWQLRQMCLSFGLKMKPEEGGFEHIGFSILMVAPGRLISFDIAGGHIAHAPGGYVAIGSGQDFALGSLHTTARRLNEHPIQRARWAIEAAIQWNHNCGGDTWVESFPDTPTP